MTTVSYSLTLNGESKVSFTFLNKLKLAFPGIKVINCIMDMDEKHMFVNTVYTMVHNNLPSIH